MENKIWKKLAQFRQIEISNEYEKKPVFYKWSLYV